MVNGRESKDPRNTPSWSGARNISTLSSEVKDPSSLLSVAEQSTSIRKARPVRRSPHLNPSQSGITRTGDISQDQRQSRYSHPCDEPTSKRKRDEKVSYSSFPAPDSVPLKQRQTSAQGTTEGQPQEPEQKGSTSIVDPIQNWVLKDTWPRECFEPADEEGRELLEQDSSSEEIMAPIPTVQYVEINGFRYPKPIKPQSAASLRRKQSDSSFTESSSQKKRESKSIPYRNPRYPILLAAKGSFMAEYKTPPKSITDLCQELLNEDQSVPHDSLFRDDLIERVSAKLAQRNEALVIQDITRLIAPSAMNLAIYGDESLEILIESVNEAWTASIAVEGPKPQPDYAVGFDRYAFTDEQLERLAPLVGTLFDTSFFMGTFRLYFPFFTCEVKCSGAALELADRQNAHSMTVAVRSIVELYRAVGREKELHQQVLGFSISHDHRTARIYGHYPVIDGKNVRYYRHPIREFIFAEPGSNDRWTAYKFTKSVYKKWMPTHFQRILSAIEQLPSGLDFEVSEEAEVRSEGATGLSENMASLASGPSNLGTASLMSQDDDESSPGAPQTETPQTSISRGARQAGRKKAKKNRSKK